MKRLHILLKFSIIMNYTTNNKYARSEGKIRQSQGMHHINIKTIWGSVK